MDSENNKTGVPVIEPLCCTRCGGTWYPRTPKRPDVCPRCKSKYWDKPRRVKKSEQQNK